MSQTFCVKMVQKKKRDVRINCDFEPYKFPQAYGDIVFCFKHFSK